MLASARRSGNAGAPPRDVPGADAGENHVATKETALPRDRVIPLLGKSTKGENTHRLEKARAARARASSVQGARGAAAARAGRRRGAHVPRGRRLRRGDGTRSRRLGDGSGAWGVA